MFLVAPRLTMIIDALQQEPPWAALHISDMTEKYNGKQKFCMEDEEFTMFKSLNVLTK